MECCKKYPKIKLFLKYYLFIQNDLSKPLTVETVDFSAGALIPFYDHDTHTVYLAGKVRKKKKFTLFSSTNITI